MRDALFWAVVLAVQYVVYVRWVRPWIRHLLVPLSKLAELMTVFDDLTRLR